MSELLVTMSELDRARRHDPAALTGLERLHRLQKEKQRKKLQDSLVQSWPIAVGLVMACFAPLLRDLVVPFDPWGMRILFPFVVLAGRHEINPGGEYWQYLPHIMLYAQFPLEGWLAKKILRGRVSFSAVTIQVLFYQLLGVAQLWLISGAIGPMASR